MRVAMPVQRDEVEEREDRNGGNQGGKEHIAQRIIGLLIHGFSFSVSGSETATAWILLRLTFLSGWKRAAAWQHRFVAIER
jgi:hypothetical protein